MSRLEKEEVLRVFRVDAKNGRVYWKIPSKFHNELAGEEAGTNKRHHTGKHYRVIRYKGCAYKRAYFIFLVAKGEWPDLIDHIDGDSLNDKPSNLRKTTPLENSWNHATHRKDSSLPRGIRKFPNGRFQARVRCDGITTYKTFPTLRKAERFYVDLRKNLFGEHCG